MEFSEQCIYLRTKLLLTQSQLANKLSVSLVTVARRETQKRKPQAIHYGKFLKLCEDNSIHFDQKIGEIL